MGRKLVRAIGRTKGSVAQIRRALDDAGRGGSDRKWDKIKVLVLTCNLPTIAVSKASGGFFAIYSYFDTIFVRPENKVQFADVCPPIEYWSANYIFFTNSGQFPIIDGLFEPMLLAYFAVPQARPDVRRAFEWSLCCP